VDRVAIALGSNLGDRAAHLDYAVARLREFIHQLDVSSYLETAPVGITGPQPLYLNAAAAGATSLDAQAVLVRLLAIEAERGRSRPARNAPRTLDLDLILFGSAIVNEPGLVVPHPRFRERRFVLAPLAEVAPDLIDPVTGRSVAALLAALSPEP
jgi:2-amino-4-hydroxy-6-hydroxymethyldihydropteridine diphosphokinase